MTKMGLRMVTAMMSVCVLGGSVPGVDISALVLNKTVQTETEASPVTTSNDGSTNVVQTVAAPKQTVTAASVALESGVAVASAESSDVTMVRVCQCKEHFVMEVAIGVTMRSRKKR